MTASSRALFSRTLESLLGSQGAVNPHVTVGAAVGAGDTDGRVEQAATPASIAVAKKRLARPRSVITIHEASTGRWARERGVGARASGSSLPASPSSVPRPAPTTQLRRTVAARPATPRKHGERPPVFG